MKPATDKYVPGTTITTNKLQNKTQTITQLTTKKQNNQTRQSKDKHINDDANNFTNIGFVVVLLYLYTKSSCTNCIKTHTNPFANHNFQRKVKVKVDKTPGK